MKDETEIVYCTKYALTSGITKLPGYTIEDGRFMAKTGGYHTCLSKNQWTRCLQEAVEFAEAMRDKKLVSLRRSITKLEKIDFTLPE